MIAFKKVNLGTEMATYSEAELLSQRAQENLETDNDFQKFVDVSTKFLIDGTLIDILTSI
jgi:hypothetical protein